MILCIFSWNLKSTTKQKSRKTTNTWRLKDPLLNNELVSHEIKEEILKKYMETKENENMTVQNLWDVEKAVLRGNYIIKQIYLKKK